MADENIVTNIVANADFSGLIADVNKVTASLSKLQAQIIQSDTRLASQVATMNRSFGENLRRTGQFSSHFVTLTSDVEKFGTNLDRGQMKLKQYFQTFQQHTKTQGGLIRDLAKQQVALQNAIIQPMGKNAQGLMQYSVHIPQGLDAVKNKTALARQELQIMNKVVQDGGVQLINWGKNTQWAGRQLTVGLTVPLAAFGKAAADAFRMADAELVRLTKVYGGVAATSAEELGKVRREVTETAREISKAYGVSFKDTITLAADIAATGKQGNELLQSVKETSRLAVLGEVDRQEAMKATLAIQTTFKQNTDQLSESINFLNSVENQTSTSLADLIEAIPKAGPVIQGMGGSVKDLALYMTAMKEGGINAAEGANALKSALASLINPTKVAKEKFADMGIDLGGIVANNAGNLTETIFELQKALDNLDPLQKQQAIEQLFGKFQFARLNALFSNLGKQGSQTLQVMDLMKASSQELEQVAGRELSMVTESASGKYKRAVEGLKADLAGIGDEFLKIQTFFINVVDGVIKFINKLPDPIKSLLTFVTGFTAIIGPVIMLTGVLANFFGYIIKGASHFRALFKGGEGWKMLTPEILAAQKAGSLVEATFYSDAKAATVLKTAIAGLVTEFELLQSKAMTGAISASPAISTMAGNVVKGSGARVVDPNHPLISAEDTRSMSHLNPVAGMTMDQKSTQTIFGTVPGAPKVNQKIGNNPQMYMSGDLPKIPGLTSIGGASTGIVAAEAAKWHAMTGALAMQSQAEIALLKKEVASTGLITASLSDSYQALLPTMTKLTANAAIESAAIVAQLQAGKITVDQARAKIIQLNAQVESMIAQASVDIAGQQGRTIGLTTVPLLNQPVVNAAGKSNMKELLRPGRTRDLLNKIARGLGVKTFGAGYSTETTIPKRFANGGVVYRGDGSDGPEVQMPQFVPMGTDTIPAMLTEGEFVVNAKATKENLPVLQAINSGSVPPLTIDASKGPVKAHASMPVSMMGHQIRDGWGDHLPAGMDDFITAFPDQEMLIKDGQILGLYREENDALRIGKRGLTKQELIRALDVPESRLFKHLPGMDAHTQTTLKNDLLHFANELPDGQMYHDDTLADIFSKSKKKTYTALPPASKESFKSVIQSASKPKYITQGSLSNLMSGDEVEMDNKQARAKSAGSTMTFKSPQRKDAVMVNGRGHVSGQTRSFKKSIQDDPKAGRPNPRLIKTPFAEKIRQAAMTASWKRSGGTRYPSKGGLMYMANGGMVQAPQYFDDGTDGPVKPGRITFGSAYSQQREKGFVGKGMMGGPMAGMGVGMGMQVAGGLLGGQTGQMMQMASILPMMAPNLLSGIPKMLGNISGGLKGVGGAAGLAGKAMGMFANAGPLLALTAAITVSYLAFKKFKEEQAQNRLEQTNSIAITEKSAAEAGIKYNNLSNSIKAVNDQLDLARAKGRNAYESLNSSGVQGLTLSIKELRENIKQAKTDQKELVATFTNIDEGTDAQRQQKVLEIATNLKAQFIAAGRSAQDATNEIYSIISASDKADMAFNAISSKGFREIVDATTAADSMILKLGENMNTLSADDLGKSISNATNALDVNLKKLMSTKDENGKIMTQQEAMATILQDINSKQGAQTTITASQLEALKETHPALAEILNTTDNIAGMYSKWRLLLAGVRTDLSKITSEQAQALATFESALDSAIETSQKAASGSGIGFKSQSSILRLQKLIAAGGQKAAVNAQKTQDQIKEEIKLIDKKIDKINEEADARKKALDAAQNKENLSLEIQKAQLAYSNKLAAGDMAGAAQEQLRIKQLVGERETQKAIDAIEENRAKREKELIKERERLQALSDKATKNLTNAQNNATSAAERMNKVDQYQNEYEGLVKEQSRVNIILDKDPKNKEALKQQDDLVRGPLSDLAKRISADSKGSDKLLREELKRIFTGTLIDKDGNSTAGKVVNTGFVPGLGSTSAYKAGDADAALAKDSKVAFDSAKAITGGKTLADVYTAILTGQGKGKVLDVNSVKSTSFNGQTWAELYKGNKQINKASFWDTLSNKRKYETLIRENGLKVGDSFILNGVKYNVKGASSIVRDESYGMATGGYVSGPGTRTSDSIPAMLSNGEFVVNAKSASSFGYGNLDRINKMAAGGLATRFDIPSYDTYSRMKNPPQESSTSNVTINATLTFGESPKNGRELWKEFKQMAKDEGAKIGENIVIGGRS
jgi:TP901 family phage tail tape measure protein